jgi:hypothetical protein
VDLLEAADRESVLASGSDDRIGLAPPAQVAGQLVAELLGRLAAVRATVQQLEQRMFGRGPASAARPRSNTISGRDDTVPPRRSLTDCTTPSWSPASGVTVTPAIVRCRAWPHSADPSDR